MLTYKQFLMLELLSRSEMNYSQRDISRVLHISLGNVNTLSKELNALSYVDKNKITAAGLSALEPYRVKRAVFMAAGFGSRLIPITLNTPKPLVRIKGKIMIESSLDALMNAGITEIYIVRGYLGEQFDQLLFKYPSLHFIDNPLYNESNNISSALLARDLFENAYVLDADLWIQKPELITPYQYHSNYLGIKTAYTDDWCFLTTSDTIAGISMGGKDCYKWIGLSYWTASDGRRLSHHIEEAIRYPGGKERFWDQVPLEYFKNEYKVHIRACEEGDVVEIDSYQDLVSIDPAYRV